ncbi:hypothetical protein NM688_g2095 [Phlebia brevispora]|uniref:Uncharacterized protein n=1 Tax=Phlebia brevispora TaxID=194682 RepID=A0ACC1T9Y3_9APHY|nr:hypothetical protein NM688_g2095 [Phlebia brevispora]
MGLDARGDVSVVELIIYVPLLFITIFLIVRHGIRKDLGWVYLVLLSIIRIVGGITHIAYESSSKPAKNLHIIASVMEASGVSPLLLASIGFLGTVKQYGFEDEMRLQLVFRLLHLAANVALILAIVGGVKAGTDTDISDIQNGISLRHAGVILFVIVFVFIALITGYLWANKSRVLMQRRKLLLAVTSTLPFLAVRVIYTVCSAFAPTGIPGVTSGNASLASFNSLTGSFVIYLIMSVLMELIAVGIYVTAGVLLPLHKDYASSAPGWDGEEDGMKLKPPAAVYAAGGQPSSYYAQY